MFLEAQSQPFYNTNKLHMGETTQNPPAGIHVIVVGAGFSGLTAAIECERKGHTVTILEKVEEIKPLGDIIGFQSNATRIFEKWEGIMEALEPIRHHPDEMMFHDWKGRFVTSQSWDDTEYGGRRLLNGNRGEIHDVIYKHAQSRRGIEIRLGHRVTDYFEDDDQAGVVVNGERVVADVVLAAEGVRSRGRKIVLGFEDAPKASGYAVYRAWFPSGSLTTNEITKHLLAGDTANAWIGEDVHLLAASVKGGKAFSWLCTHKDEGDIEEDWQHPGKVEDALKCLEGWDPIVIEMVKATPESGLVDYKLAFRDPLPTFISPKARIVLIGDSAHPFLPTAVQGAAQAMEDGAVVAVCLELAGGPSGIPRALRTYEKLRYDRVHKIQATGITNREQWHKADWDYIWKNPKALHLQREPWILGFDAEQDAYDNYYHIAEGVERLQSKGT